jgi:hypothetical protein
MLHTVTSDLDKASQHSIPMSYLEALTKRSEIASSSSPTALPSPPLMIVACRSGSDGADARTAANAARTPTSTNDGEAVPVVLPDNRAVLRRREARAEKLRGPKRVRAISSNTIPQQRVLGNSKRSGGNPIAGWRIDRRIHRIHRDRDEATSAMRAVVRHERDERRAAIYREIISAAGH